MVCLDRFPAGFPLPPVLVAGLGRDDSLGRQGSIVPMLGCGIRRRGRAECEQHISGNAFLALAEFHGLEDLLLFTSERFFPYPNMKRMRGCYRFVIVL